MERSVEHINALFDSAIAVLETASFNQTFSIQDNLAPYRDHLDCLTLAEISKIKDSLDTYLRQKRYSPYQPEVVAPVSHSAYQFIEGIRRYFLSSEMRRELKRGVVFKSNLKKRKLQESEECAELRLLACQKYRDLVARVNEKLLQSDLPQYRNISKQNKMDILRCYDSDLQCEQCGLRAENHRRAGLQVENLIESIKNQ